MEQCGEWAETMSGIKEGLVRREKLAPDGQSLGTKRVQGTKERWELQPGTCHGSMV